ncbi:HlyD family secretion protein [Rhizobium sp. SL42]|uniref:HlyD family secretion protein n=1 Tax=Rhizobium sp. SL42 TaxID=2806346 RepID=UPI001F21A6C7|nr:HlyD family efflux transporter periplasmic adaptor subunit [Rhizobium sp. SL42]UJW76013.1 HlyD family efflux transporter periplasmic adaptor subunit [Rhizobium sp. SL42]
MANRQAGWLAAVLAVVIGGTAYYGWKTYEGDGLPAGIASGNGRIEAVEIDISTKTAGRIKEILADEGDFIAAGQVVAVMDTTQLEAEQRQLQAQLRRAEIGVDAAQSVVAQRQAEREAADATVAQRQAQLDAASIKLARAERLLENKTTTQQAVDDDRASVESAKAAVAAARAQVAASDAAISSARAQVVDAGAAVEAAKAAIESIAAQLREGMLRAPRDGRVQYRVAQPGEVLAAGGRVLNIVDLGDVFMSFFLPTSVAGRVALGSEVRLVLDAAPGYVIPAKVSFVADVAQFTPKTVETEEERQKLMFRIKAKVASELLRKHMDQIKTGLPGMAYVRVDPAVEWPQHLTGTLVQ